MSEHLLLGLATIIVLGIVAQWLAWRLHLPAILLLLISGIMGGPVSGILSAN
jgi:NhaP-type Na+/H+ or K+/H+ antiporter